MHGVVDWLFRNRQTGAITIAQMPNPALWLAIVATALGSVWQPPARSGINLDCVVKTSLVVWALDELLRGVNPWRRFLGAAVLVHLAATVTLRASAG